MAVPKTLQTLSFGWAILASIGPMISLFGPAEGQSLPFINVWGEQTTLTGVGLYAAESPFKASINQGTDAVILFGLIPVLLWNTFRLRYRPDGSPLWLQAGLMACALYYSALQVFEVVFNSLYLVYVGGFSLSFFAFVYSMILSRRDALQQRLTLPYPRTGTLIFLLVAGTSVAVWLLDIATALRQSRLSAQMGPSVTLPTYAIDLALIGPTVFLAAWLLYQRAPLGLLLAVVILTLNAFIGFVVIGQTLFQVKSGIVLSLAQFLPFVAVFVILSSFALVLVVRLLSWPKISR